jgi:NhaP-type Na+/H+ or K+/H+ antiporter
MAASSPASITAPSSSALWWKLLSLALAVYIAVDKLAAGRRGEGLGSAGETGFVAQPQAQPQVAAPAGLRVDPVDQGAGSSSYDGRHYLSISELQDDAHRKLAGDASNCTSDCSSTNSPAAAAVDICPSDHAHPHDALFYLFNAILLGTLILHLTVNYRRLHGLQQTVVLFLIGVAYSLFNRLLELHFSDLWWSEDLRVVRDSYCMWMQIDPTLLLFALLPALLTGDAMTIDTCVARAVSKQCIFLAGPGVLFCTLANGVFMWLVLPYEAFGFKLCLVVGSILSATDPVAVVTLLKQLGTKPTLTVQIQGESLLNNGTAIVLYTLAYNALKGEIFEVGEIIIFLVKTALCAAGLGYIIGRVFLAWIRVASKRLQLNIDLIQTSLTLLCAYWSFIVAEGLLKISGVLSCVTAALVLADKMWPAITDQESMLHVWHMFGFIANTLVFFLAGSLAGQAVLTVPLQDYGFLILIYFANVAIRFCLLFGSRPLLGLLSEDKEPVSAADAIVISWAGIRGAVGLALAIQVNKLRIGIDALTGQRVLFYVAGIAFLNLVINITTTSSLVRILRITNTPMAKKRMIISIYSQLLRLTWERGHPEFVRQVIEESLQEAKINVGELNAPVEEEVAAYDNARRLTRRAPAGQRAQDIVWGTNSPLQMSLKNLLAGGLSHFAQKFGENSQLQDGAKLVKTLLSARKAYNRVCDPHLYKLMDMPELSWLDRSVESQKEIERLLAFVHNEAAEAMMLKSVNEAFLSVVRAHYWAMTERGEFFGSTREAEMLLNSVAFAMKHPEALLDFKYLKQQLQNSVVSSWDDPEQELSRISADKVEPTASEASVHSLASLVVEAEAPWKQIIDHGMAFNITIMLLIILNSIFIIGEQQFRDDSNYSHPGWLIVEIAFNVAFILEFIFKFVVLRCRYFRDPWNIFDFALILVGLAGLVVEYLAVDETGSGTAEARMLRVNRVFRVLRIFRVFRLTRFVAILISFRDKDVHLEIAEYLQVVSVLRAFVQAHTHAQLEFLNFLGEDGHAVTVEQARTILESQTFVYKAISFAAVEASKCDHKTLRVISRMRSVVVANMELTEFIHDVVKVGIINHKEAATVKDPLQSRVRELHRSAHLMQMRGSRNESCKISIRGIAEPYASEAPSSEPEGYESESVGAYAKADRMLAAAAEKAERTTAKERNGTVTEARLTFADCNCGDEDQVEEYRKEGEATIQEEGGVVIPPDGMPPTVVIGGKHVRHGGHGRRAGSNGSSDAAGDTPGTLFCAADPEELPMSPAASSHEEFRPPGQIRTSSGG